MVTYYYNGPPPAPPEEPVKLPPDIRSSLDAPEGYLPEPGLVKAVNIALILGQPLLLTGAPGVGKTQLAHALSYALGLGRKAEICSVKSDTVRSNLLYEFDHLDRMADRTGDARKPLHSYVRLNGLGKAMVLAAGPDAQTEPLEHANVPPLRMDDLLPRSEFERTQSERRVVLIDEIDKAPRDLPNDLLYELDQMAFEISEIGQRIVAPAASRPVVVITSNSEKHLPAPFLRRCTYYDIPLPPRRSTNSAPDEVTLEKIIAKRIAGLKVDSPLLTDALSVFEKLRDRAEGLQHPPSVAELLNWLLLLVHDARIPAGDRLSQWPDAAIDYLPSLIKETSDQNKAKQLVERLTAGD